MWMLKHYDQINLLSNCDNRQAMSEKLCFALGLNDEDAYM